MEFMLSTVLSSHTKLTDSVVVLSGVSWQTYLSLREEDSNRHVYMTFDRGRLFLMSPGRLHERIGALLARFVCVWTEIRAIPISSGGSTTMKHELVNRGLEPDECFYIQNEAAVRQTDSYDAATDPPPDLVIEVDVTSISTVRMPIYAEFGVPEIWRWHDEKLEVFRLQGKTYLLADASICLPQFPIQVATAFLDKRHDADETSLLIEFRKHCSSAHTPGPA